VSSQHGPRVAASTNDAGAQERLDAARAALTLRAEWVEADYPLIAEGFRRLLEETEGGALSVWFTLPLAR